jgi:RNA polymerase sigma factor (sigma-70 family)
MLAATMTESRPGGADQAIAELRPLVRAVVARVLGAAASEADVEDGAHEALRRALEGRERLRPGEPVGPWVVGIARHVALDQRRARGRRREDGGEHGAAAIEAAVDPGPGVDTSLDTRRQAARLEAALADLPDGARSALIAFHLEGLGYQEIARRLGVPLGTVATWVARGRKRLVEIMEGRPS